MSRVPLLFLAATLMVEAPALYGQAAPCGLTSMKASHALIYPPIARTAQVTGAVIFLITFAADGAVQQAKFISGPLMLRQAASDFAKGLTTNAAQGTRECPVVIRFQLIGSSLDCGSKRLPETNAPPPEFTDPQHYVITAVKPCVETMA